MNLEPEARIQCHRNKPPLKNKKSRAEGNERALSIDARSESVTEKFLTPEAQWKNVLTDIMKKNDWESQFKACNLIKDFSSEHQHFFKSSDPFFNEIMAELSNL